MGEDHHEQKHICKLCSKVFPSGRSLGGHMRSHLITVPSDHHNHLPKQRIRSRRQPNRSLERRGAAAADADTDALLGGNLCRECGRSFHSLKALFGHMKCHSLNGKPAGEEASNSDDEAPRRKRSGRVKKKKNKKDVADVDAIDSSSSLIMSEIEQQEQEEVALSLIILSMDRGGDWCSGNQVLKDGEFKGESNEPEVSSKSMIQPVKRKCIDNSDQEYSQEVEHRSKFTCSICHKGFPSYQALGGHRASHKKFKGCCAPLPAENTSEAAEDSPNTKPVDPKEYSSKGKDHECPICLKVFSSGQALGGHKRSHLVADQAQSRPPQPQGIRRFIDLNLPAPPDEEDCSDLKPWWMLGLLST